MATLTPLVITYKLLYFSFVTAPNNVRLVGSLSAFEGKQLRFNCQYDNDTTAKSNFSYFYDGVEFEVKKVIEKLKNCMRKILKFCLDPQ